MAALEILLLAAVLAFLVMLFLKLDRDERRRKEMRERLDQERLERLLQAERRNRPGSQP